MKIGRVQRDTPLEAADASSPSSAVYASGPPCSTPSSISTSPALSDAEISARSSLPSATTDSSSLMPLRLQIVVGSQHSSPSPKEYPSPPSKESSPPPIRAVHGPQPVARIQHHSQHNKTTDSRTGRDGNIDSSRIQSSIPTREDASAPPPMPHNGDVHVDRFRSWPRSNHSCKGYIPPHKSRRTLRDLIKDAPSSWQLQETALQGRLLEALADKALHPVVDHLGEGATTLTSEAINVHARQTTLPIVPGPLTNEARPDSGDKMMKELAAKCTHTLEAQLSALLQRAAEEKACLEAKNAELAAQLELIHAKEREEAKRAHDNLLFALEQKEELRVLKLRLRETVHNHKVERERHRLTREKAEDAIYALQMALDDTDDGDGEFSDGNFASQTSASDTTPSRSTSPEEEDLALRAWAQATLKQDAQRRVLDTNAVAAARGVWLDILAQARITSMIEDFSPSHFSLEVPLTVNSAPWPVLANPLELTLDVVDGEGVKAFCENMERYSSEAVYRERLLRMWRLFRVEGWEVGLVSVMDERLREDMRDTVVVVCEALAAVLRERGWEEEEEEEGQERWDDDIFVGDEQEEIDEVASELEVGDDDETY